MLRPADSESSEHLKNGQVRCSQKVRRLCTLRGVGGGDNTCRVCAVCDSSVPGASAPAPVVFLHNATGNPAPVHGDEPPHVELVLVFRPGVRPMYTISVPVHDMGKTLNISLQSLFEHTTGLWELVLTLGVLVYLGDVLPSSQHPLTDHCQRSSPPCQIMCCVVSDDCTDNSKDVLHQFLLSLTKNFSASRHEICDGKVDVCTQVSQVVLQQRTRVAVDLVSVHFRVMDRHRCLYALRWWKHQQACGNHSATTLRCA